MTEFEFCPKCELWNKHNPDLPQRDPYYDTLLCPICYGGQTRNIDDAIKQVSIKYTISQIDKYLTDLQD